MAAGEVIAEGRQHQPRECEQAQTPGEGFSEGHGDLRGGAVAGLGEWSVVLRFATSLPDEVLTHL